MENASEEETPIPVLPDSDSDVSGVTVDPATTPSIPTPCQNPPRTWKPPDRYKL